MLVSTRQNKTKTTVIAENEGYNAMFVAWLSPQPMIEHHCYFTGQSFFRVNYSLYLITFCLTLSRHYYIFDFSVFIGTKWPTGVECYNVLVIMELDVKTQKGCSLAASPDLVTTKHSVYQMLYLKYCAASHQWQVNLNLMTRTGFFTHLKLNVI